MKPSGYVPGQLEKFILWDAQPWVQVSLLKWAPIYPAVHTMFLLPLVDFSTQSCVYWKGFEVTPQLCVRCLTDMGMSDYRTKTLLKTASVAVTVFYIFACFVDSCTSSFQVTYGKLSCKWRRNKAKHCSNGMKVTVLWYTEKTSISQNISSWKGPTGVRVQLPPYAFI